MKTVRKALAGAVSAAAAVFGTTIADGDLSVTDIGLIVGAAVVGFLGVYLAPANVVASPIPPSIAPPQVGDVN